jgi:hypothetical protein
MSQNIYLICPVRRCTPEVRAVMDAYVAGLEARGHKVHYPPRDVDQSNDDGGVRICQEHLHAMLACDAVHVWWDPASTGSHFDLGMAYAMHAIRLVLHLKLGVSGLKELDQKHGIDVGPIPQFFIANHDQVKTDPEKSFTNVLLSMAEMPRVVTHD